MLARVNADGQAALREGGLEGARTHHEQSGLRRHAIDLFGRVRLGQEFHHFNLCSHTLVLDLFAVNVPLRTLASR